jgi:hypothetical protein
MKRLRAWQLWVSILIWQLVPWRGWAEGEGLDVPEALDKKVSLEGLSGISRFFAENYNEHLWLYAVYCTLLMAAVGIAIAFVTDFILSAVGLDVTKIEHKE